MTCLALAVAAVGLAGCEGAQQAADQPAQDQMAAAEKALLQNQLGAAGSASDSAASTPDISPIVSVQAHNLQ
ncbi:MAG: hypothetical protein ABSH22_07340, partial [Tepidisphaeraceae bacterium]